MYLLCIKVFIVNKNIFVHTYKNCKEKYLCSIKIFVFNLFFVHLLP